MCMLPPGEWRGEYSSSITICARDQPKPSECASLRESRTAVGAAGGRAQLYGVSDGVACCWGVLWCGMRRLNDDRQRD